MVLPQSPLPDFLAQDGRILMDGEPLALRGVSWFGMEGKGAMVDGLWEQPMADYVRFVASENFNALRIPLAMDNVKNNPKIDADMVTKDPAMLSLARSGGRYLDGLDQLVRLAAHAGLLVMLDMHRLEAATWPDPHGLWYRVPTQASGRAGTLPDWRAL